MDKLDILNRDEFVKQLVRLVENIADNKTSTCFAINGAWGSGKSFVLEMFEEELSLIQSEETFNDKYFIVHYNCWKYDYYEEPLIAIVSSILTEIERKTKVVSDNEQIIKTIGMLKSISGTLLKAGNVMVKAKTGIDVKTGFEILLKGRKEGVEKHNKKYEYDKYFQLNKVIDTLSDSLQKIATEYTVVIIVDELDRCIPEYAIKVLERLHHLTEGKSNIITIIATDKKQLECSVRHLFGFAEGNKYLEKFVNFEIKLDKGEVSENIIEKYADYLGLFDEDIFQFDDSVEECLQALFKDIDIRTQEQIVNKAKVAHKLLFTDRKDYSFMCMELLTAIMIGVYKYRGLFVGGDFNASSYGGLVVSASKQNSSPFDNFFKEKFESINLRRSHSFSDEPAQYVLPAQANLYGAILFTWCWMHSKRSVSIQHTKGDVYSTICNNHEELIKFAEMIYMM